MRRKLKNLKNKGGHSLSVGAPKAAADEMRYREHGSAVYAGGRRYTGGFSGWSWATRPLDLAISVRKRFVPFPVGPSAPSGPT